MDKYQGSGNRDHKNAKGGTDTAGDSRCVRIGKVQIKNWINRYNREQARLGAGLPRKRRGRPRGNGYTTIEECQYEIQRLKIENKLLRDSLRFTGRK